LRLRLFGSFGVGQLAEVLSGEISVGIFERAGMGLLLGDANFRQILNKHSGFNFKLARQFVNSNLTWFCH
jgi:hypothetical protein